MTLSERPPRKRHRRERFDYEAMFDGRSWELTPKDYQGRSQVKAYHLIRQAAWRRKLNATIEFVGDKLIVQVKKEASTNGQ